MLSCQSVRTWAIIFLKQNALDHIKTRIMGRAAARSLSGASASSRGRISRRNIAVPNRFISVVSTGTGTVDPGVGW